MDCIKTYTRSRGWLAPGVAKAKANIRTLRHLPLSKRLRLTMMVVHFSHISHALG
jgi:hypothetical protein